MKSTNSSTPVFIGALAIANILGATLFVVTHSTPAATPTSTAASNQTATRETATTQKSNFVNPSVSGSPVSSSGYKDGTYTARANYSVPRGNNSISVALTLTNGVVRSVKSTHDYNDRESGMYIDSFDSRIESIIVGRSLESIALSRVGGASLTTHGFDDALASIATQAKP